MPDQGVIAAPLGHRLVVGPQTWWIAFLFKLRFDRKTLLHIDQEISDTIFVFEQCGELLEGCPWFKTIVKFLVHEGLVRLQGRKIIWALDT